MSNNIKKIADGFIKQHRLKSINYSSLKDVAISMGYTIIEFNNILNEKDVETVIQNLKLSEAVKGSRGFTYVSRDHRLVFINADLNDEEKLLVLSHEIGHIVCGHFSTATIIGKDVKEEYEANEFSHYLLHQSVFRKIKRTMTAHRRAFIIAAVILCVSFVSLAIYLVVQDKSAYADNLYITPTGTCYHKKDCIFVKNKSNSQKLTVEAFESGDYSPCDICLPDKN